MTNDPILTELRIISARLSTLRPISYRRVASAVAAGVLAAAFLLVTIKAVADAIAASMVGRLG